MEGTDGEDTLSSTNSHGVIFDGKGGVDTLTGTSGADSFILELADGARAKDIVKSFADGTDKIRVAVVDELAVTQLSDVGLATKGEFGANFSVHTVVTYTHTPEDGVETTEDVMLLEGFNDINDITIDDFEFVTTRDVVNGTKKP